MSEKKVTKYIEGPDAYSIGQTAITVTEFSDGTTVVRREFGLNYYSQIALDGDSNMIVEWSHGGGQGKLAIPNGECFDIYESLKIMHLQQNLFAKRPLYKLIDEAF